MSDGRESENLEADLTPNAQQVKEVLEQGVRDFVDVEEFKAAGVASPPEAPKDAPDAAVPPDLPTEADAAAYLGLLEIAASAEVDQESATADAEGEAETGASSLPACAYRYAGIETMTSPEMTKRRMPLFMRRPFP